ncbi:MAG: hypothetical protein IPI01_18045 [Ignavibacteriae bacterium]|nr:hypothetical protein [Ignavibacteriota bacterium]
MRRARAAIHDRARQGLRRAGNAPAVRGRRSKQGNADGALRPGPRRKGSGSLCTRLAEFGTDASVPLLAAMLKKPETFDVARYGSKAFPGKVSERVPLDADGCGNRRPAHRAFVNTIGNRRIGPRP